MTRVRVLLVDDQPLILLALERMLRRQRNVWEVVAAGSGAKAQDLMEQEPFDVLVTDLNMPGYGGVELLEWTRTQRPATARNVLSGHQDKRMILGATRTAHRFLTKPCVPEQLMEAILQTSGLLTLTGGEGGLRAAVGAMGQLPGSPVTCHKVKACFEDPGSDLLTLKDIVTQDPGLAAQVLHLVNGAFFGVPRPVVDPWEALQLLDHEKLASLVAEPVGADLEARLKPVREAHLGLALRARAITRVEGAPRPVQDLAYTAGLLAAAGPIILATASTGGTAPDPLQVARHYLNLMGLPAPLLELVENHRQPSRAQNPDSLALAALHVASGQLDQDFLTRTGYLERVPRWRQSMLDNEGCP